MIIASSDEAMLERALAMSMETGEDEPMIVQEKSGSTSGSTAVTAAAVTASEVDFNNMTEEEQIAFAMQMSMQDSAVEEKASSSGPNSKEEAMDVDYSEVMNDPEFIQSVLENLPGVDPQSDAVRQAVGLVSKDSKDKDQKNDKDKNSKK
jgi:26S proteasome regulatory subunit N10